METKLTNIPIPVSASKMGRPSLKVKPILIRLPEGMAERIDAIMGKENRRAEFIRDAVEAEVRKRESPSIPPVSSPRQSPEEP